MGTASARAVRAPKAAAKGGARGGGTIPRKESNLRDVWLGERWTDGVGHWGLELAGAGALGGWWSMEWTSLGVADSNADR